MILFLGNREDKRYPIPPYAILKKNSGKKLELKTYNFKIEDYYGKKK